MARYASVYVLSGMAYLPTLALPEGMHMTTAIGPIYTSTLSPEDLARALEQVLVAGHPSVVPVDLRDFFPTNHPLLTAAHATSWKDLERRAFHFAIAWLEDHTSVVYDDASTGGSSNGIDERVLAVDAPPRIVASVILQCVDSHMADERLLNMVAIYVRDGKAYLPVQGRIAAGHFARYKPVYTSDLTLHGLTEGIEKVLAAGHPVVPHAANRFDKPSPVLRAARVDLSRHFRQGLCFFTIAWREETTRLYIADLTRDPVRGPLAPCDFPAGTPVLEIVDVILRYMADPAEFDDYL